MILVCGASGQLGRLVVQHLLQLNSAEAIAVGGRSVDKLQSWSDRGAEIRHVDYDDPATLDTAFRGICRVLLISSSGIDNQRRVAQHQAVIDAAAQAGVKHLDYTSLIPGDSSSAHVMKAHQATEAYLRQSELSWTILRNGIYAESWPLYLGDFSNGTAQVIADGPVAWVAKEDLAEGIARLLTQKSEPPSIVELTGPTAITLSAAVRLAGEILGRTIPLEIVDEATYVRRQIAAGKSERWARQWATTFRSIAAGDFGRVSPRLQQLLGRQMTSFENVLGRTLKASS